MAKAICVVDAQNDFINENGALSVPNARNIRKYIQEAIKFGRERGLTIFYTQDDHDGTEPEMSVKGGPFPLHCMKDTEGQKNIPEATPARGEKVFTKRCYDVFDKTMGNKKIEKWLKDQGITEVWVVGCVGNICVEAVVRGLRKLGIETYIFDEAVVWMDLPKGIFCEDADNKEKSVARMRELGAHMARFVL